jgi:hypothetical protein
MALGFDQYGPPQQEHQGPAVPTLQAIIAAKFFDKLARSKAIDAPKIEQLEELFATGKKIKVDDLVRVFSLPVGSDLK